MNKLLPCPFCRGEAAMCDIKERLVNGWVSCQRCRYFMDFVNNGKPQAIAAWNRRTGKDINVATNADHIRSMSDKELAEYIFDLGNGSEYCYGHCAYQDDCATKGFDHDTCMKGVIDWLRQPAKEEI